MPKLPSGSKITSRLDGGGDEDIVYKWRDAEGNLQFTSEPPPQGIEYDRMGFDPNTNVIQAVKPPAEIEEPAKAESPEKKAEGSGNPYSPERIEKLLDDAKNVEQLLKQRIKDQEAAINQ